MKKEISEMETYAFPKIRTLEIKSMSDNEQDDDGSVPKLNEEDEKKVDDDDENIEGVGIEGEGIGEILESLPEEPEDGEPAY